MKRMFLRQNVIIKVTMLALVMIGSVGLVDSVSASSYTLSLTSSGAQSINATGAGGAVISSDSINVVTTCKSGYNFTINTSVNDNNLYLGGDASQNESGKYFTPADGTTTLANSTNTWGYYYNASDPSTTPTSSNIFSPVPTLESPATIISPRATPSSTDINDNFNIYYGVSVSPSMPVGTYKMIPDTNNSNNDGTIVYTATISEDCMKYTVHFNPSSYFEGNLITGTGTMSDQSMFENITADLAANTFTAPSGYYFAGWNTAQDGSGTSYTNQQSVTDLTSAGNTITLYAMWTDCPANTICYLPNVSNPNDVEGEMGNQSITSSDAEAVLYAPNYSRADYGFAAWNTKPDGTGTNYGPNQTIEFTAGAYNTGGLKLYAKWIASAGTMQSFSASDCSAMNIGDVTARKDARDNNTYAVAKLADGKCWMIENLRLDNTASHNTDGSLAQGYNSSFIGLADPESAKFSNSTTANSLYSTDGSTVAPAITGNDTSYRFPRYNNNNTSSRQSSSGYSASGNTYSMGNYYTWSAAIADTTYYSTNNQSIENTSLCPAGWRLPKGGNSSNATNSEFWQLGLAIMDNVVPDQDNSGNSYYSNTPTNNAGDTATKAFRKYPNNFLYSGRFYGSSADSRGSRGYYWSSTAGNNLSSYYLLLGSSNVDPGTDYYGKNHGYSIRCTLGS